MTVKKLRKLLKTMPKDAEVFFEKDRLFMGFGDGEELPIKRDALNFESVFLDKERESVVIGLRSPNVSNESGREKQLIAFTSEDVMRDYSAGLCEIIGSKKGGQ